jgi:hypothetical protein
MLIFSTSIRNLMLGRGLLANLSSPCSISVYTGAQPTAANFIANWSSYSSGNPAFLVHYTGAVWNQPSNGVLMQLATVPAATAPANTGTATWCIIWSTAITGIQMAAGTVPSNNFIIGPCSDAIGDGIIRFSNPALVASTPVVILDGSIGATS